MNKMTKSAKTDDVVIQPATLTIPITKWFGKDTGVDKIIKERK